MNTETIIQDSQADSLVETEPIESIYSDIPSVSGGDVPITGGQVLTEYTMSVSDGSTGTYADVVSALSTTNYLLTAILFFAVFQWIETKVRVGVRRMMRNDRIN